MTVKGHGSEEEQMGQQARQGIVGPLLLRITRDKARIQGAKTRSRVKVQLAMVLQMPNFRGPIMKP